MMNKATNVGLSKLAFDQLQPAVENDMPLLTKVLRPYHGKDCEYLKSAKVQKQADRVVGCGEFGIKESCYIDDTGHFNAVEFNICYNQIMYYVIAKAVKDGLMAEFTDWTLDDYWQRQLPDVLISRINSNFKRPINARHFFGEIEFVQSNLRTGKRPILFLNTVIRFYDEFGGYGEGEVGLALVNPVLPPDTVEQNG